MKLLQPWDACVPHELLLLSVKLNVPLVQLVNSL
jgi:hypothetical protein